MKIDNITINGGNSQFAKEIVNGEPVEPQPLDLEKIQDEEKEWSECGKLKLHPDIKDLIERYQAAKKRVSGRNNKSQAINRFLCIFNEPIEAEIEHLNKHADINDQLKK